MSTKEDKARDAVVALGTKLAARGLCPGTSGNISVRIDDGWLMTPTNSSLGELDVGKLSKLDTNGKHVGGDPPTKEALLHRSVYGRWLYAVGKNEEAARFSGISTRIVIATAYIISGGLAGVSTVLFVFYTNSVSPSSFGNFYELYAIAAAVLGGCSLRGGEGSILGIVLGTALLQVLQNLVNILGIPNSLNFAVMGTVILLGVLADQQLQARRRRKVALEGLVRTAPRSTRVHEKESASPRGAAALRARTGDQA